MYITDGVVERLSYAIVMQAVNDYKNALRTYRLARSQRKREEQQYVIEECERFFRKDMGLHSGLDGEAMIARLREGDVGSLKRKWVMLGAEKA